MSYTPFDGTKPVTSDTRQQAFDYILANENALRDMVIMGSAPGFDFSVSGGTAAQPDIMYAKSGASWLRASITWGTSGGADGNPTVIVYAFSGDSGGAWSTIKTLTLSWDSDGYLTTGVWS